MKIHCLKAARGLATLVLTVLLVGPIPSVQAQVRKATKAIEYQSPNTPVEQGKAPGLQTKLLSDVNGVKTYALIFAKGDEVLSGLTDFVAQQQVQAASFSAVGAFQKATTGWFDPQKKLYRLNRVQGPIELVSLLGDVALFEGKPVIHGHMSVGHPDGHVEGGHLIEGYVFPTVELLLTVYPTPLYKKTDPETDLKLIDPAAKQ
jgi:predicted DNA-binding protein with PD1-like motif